MSMFSSLKTDKLDLIKQNGESYTNIPANVQPKKIFIDDTSIPIEEGDMLVRVLPNGLKEQYLVIERGYYGEFHGIPPHYQVSVEKQTSHKKTSTAQITYNFNASSEKININSTDNSNSTYILAPVEKEQFANLRNTIVSGIESPDLLIKLVDEMESDVGRPSFLEKYTNFIQSAANHVTLLAPFIPFLSKFIPK